MVEKVLLASPRGYCAGVERAVETVEQALDLYGAAGLRPQADRPQPARRARARGARRDLRRGRDRGAGGRDDGASRPTASRRRCTRTRQRAGCGRSTRPARSSPRCTSRRGATPPTGYTVDPDRPRRPRGGRRHDGRDRRTRSCSSSRARTSTRSTFPGDAKLAYVTQTTLSVDETGEVIAALRERFPSIHAPQTRRHLLRDLQPPVGGQGDARRDRPAARDRLAQLVELEPARRDSPAPAASPSHLIDDETEIDEAWLDGVAVVGITSGASAPEKLVAARLRLVPRARRDRDRAVPLRRGGHRVPPAGRAAPRARARRSAG